ncbi:Rne/Rng family ribonuclease [bacterium]|nr:Rne/Rng family ribonuclease [bacterium]
MHNVRKEIVVTASSTETRIAILEDGCLVELFFENMENERMVGDIYKGRVVNVVEAVHAGFIDIGLKQNGFLSFSDLGGGPLEFAALAETVETDDEDDPDADPKAQPASADGKQPPQRRPRRRGGRGGRGGGQGGGPRHERRSFHLRPGQEIIVQIAKEPINTKGARLTAMVSLPGRFCVLVPNDATVGVSKKIESDHERHRLRKIARQLCPPGFGLIVRTVAAGKDFETLKADLDHLTQTWREIEATAKANRAPMLLHKDMGMTSSIMRDLFTPDITRVLIDSKKLHAEIREYLAEVSPGLLPKVELYRDHVPVFDRFKVEEQIERSLARKIWLRRGGSIIFDQTEAMTVIDVNSGRSVGHRDQEINAYETDLEAAREIGRQLRLRDIGGIVTIDFIDLRNEKLRKRIVNELHKELKKDQAVFDILPMNDFGLVSLTRERVRPSLFARLSENCPRCEGLGRVPTKSMLITQIERRIQQVKTESGARRLVMKVHPELADYLSEGGLKSRVKQFMAKYLVMIKLVRDETQREEDFTCTPAGEEKKKGKKGWRRFFGLTS